MASLPHKNILQKAFEEYDIPALFSNSYLTWLINDYKAYFFGGGAHGRCYVTSDLKPNYVLKFVADDWCQVKGLVQEIKALSGLKHIQGVQKMFGVCPDRLCFLTEFAGITLTSATERRCLNFTDKIEIIRQIAVILTEIHKAGWVHIDLKPDNVCIAKTTDDQLQVTIIDFGLALPVGGRHNFPRGTRPQHTAPETLWWEANYPSADCFSFAVLIQELLGEHFLQTSDDFLGWVSSSRSLVASSRGTIAELLALIDNGKYCHPSQQGTNCPAPTRFYTELPQPEVYGSTNRTNYYYPVSFPHADSAR